MAREPILAVDDTPANLKLVRVLLTRRAQAGRRPSIVNRWAHHCEDAGSLATLLE